MTIKRPIFLRDKQIAALELRLRNLAEEYARITPDQRFTFFWRNMTNGFRNRGKLLPGNTEVRNSQDRAGAEPRDRLDPNAPDRT